MKLNPTGRHTSTYPHHFPKMMNTPLGLSGLVLRFPPPSKLPVVGRFDVAVTLRRHLAIPPCPLLYIKLTHDQIANIQ
jgi:hypothetical protein